jgi:hypothetical protein
VQLPPFSRHLIPLRSKYSSQNPVLKHHQSILLPTRRRICSQRLKSLVSEEKQDRIMPFEVYSLTFKKEKFNRSIRKVSEWKIRRM